MNHEIETLSINVNINLSSHDNFILLRNFKTSMEVAALKDVCKLYGLTGLINKLINS